MPYFFELAPKFNQEKIKEIEPNEKEILSLTEEIREKIKIQRGDYNLNNPKEKEKYLKELKEFEKEEYLESPDIKRNRRKELLVKTLFGIEHVLQRKELREKNLEKGERRKIDIQDAQWLQDVMEYILSNERNLKAIKKFWQTYNEIFGQNDFPLAEKLRAGILGSLAVTKIFNQELKMKIRCSQPEEDVDWKIDLVAEPKQYKNLRFCLQIKTNNIYGKGFTHEDELITIYQDLEEKQKSWSEKESEREKFKKGCRQFREKYNCQVIGIWLTIPTNKIGPKKIKAFDEETGQPLPQYVAFIKRKLLTSLDFLVEAK